MRWRGAHGVRDSLVAGFVHWIAERGSPSILALGGNHSQEADLVLSTLVRSILVAVEWVGQFLPGEKSLPARALGPSAQLSHPLGSFLLCIHTALTQVLLPTHIQPRFTESHHPYLKISLVFCPKEGPLKPRVMSMFVCFPDPIFPSLTTLRLPFCLIVERLGSLCTRTYLLICLLYTSVTAFFIL